MNLPGIVQLANPGLLGFDTDAVVTAAAAKQFFQQGYRFCGRYLTHDSTPAATDLTADEAMDILSAGLALFAVQHVPPANWAPSAALGTTFGTNAVNHAQNIGLPTGMNLWCDLEGIARGTSAEDVISYCKAWYEAVSAAHYEPGLYVGAESVLTGSQLYNDLPFKHYWRSLSRVPDIEKRGYQMVQHRYQEIINGIAIDTDNTQNDNLGGQVLWLNPVIEQPSPANSQPTIAYGPNVNKGVISAHAIDVISKILVESGNMHALITSGARTPHEQAKAMYDNIVAHGVASQKSLYSEYGDQVIDVYVQQKGAGKSEADILSAMEVKIHEVGPGHVSRHCADFNKLVVVDIAPSSVANKNEFVAVASRYAANGTVSKLFYPPDDPAFHLEIPNAGL